MVWTETGGQFPGDVLTSELWNQLSANFQAMGDGDAGAPSVSVENALESTGTEGYVLVVGPSGAVLTSARITLNKGVAVDDGGNGIATLTIPYVMSTTAGSIFRWSVCNSTGNSGGGTLSHAHGYVNRPSVQGATSWSATVDDSVNAGALTVSVNGSNQLVLTLTTSGTSVDMNLDTFNYMVEVIA